MKSYIKEVAQPLFPSSDIIEELISPSGETSIVLGWINKYVCNTGHDDVMWDDNILTLPLGMI